MGWEVNAEQTSQRFQGFTDLPHRYDMDLMVQYVDGVSGKVIGYLFAFYVR